MFAISVRQPWAWAIFHGKPVENRLRPEMWKRAVGTRLAIHTGSNWSKSGEENPLIIRAVMDRLGTFMVSTLPAFERSAFIGSVLLTEIHPAGCKECGPWSEYMVGHLVFADARMAPMSVPSIGRLGMWEVPADVEEKLLVVEGEREVGA